MKQSSTYQLFCMKKIVVLMVALIASFSCSKDKKSASAAVKMQDFVIDISNYARQSNPDFIIIPQNGIELAFNGVEPEEGLHTVYMNAIDGFGVEELFYNGTANATDERYDYLQQLKATKKIMVSEFVTNDSDIPDAYAKNDAEGFVCFPRSNDNYYYNHVPGSIHQENTANINQLSDVKNYLYLINPENYSSKQDMINALALTNYDLLLIDLFFNGEQLTASEVNQLKTKANGGKRLVVSYINIGSAEKYRYYWKSNWKKNRPGWIKKKYDGYDDEFWVKFWHNDWKTIIYGNDDSYMKKILNAGFDGAYLDNVEAYYFLYHKE